MNPRHRIRNQKERASEKREIPLLPRYLSDTAYGNTNFGPSRHNTNGRDITPTAWGNHTRSPKTWLPGICRCGKEESNDRTAATGNMRSLRD